MLKPNLWITASYSGILNTLGFSLPNWGIGVTVPNSKKPKPKSNKPGIASAFLSKPAAKPTGFSKDLPNTSVRKLAKFFSFLKILNLRENKKSLCKISGDKGLLILEIIL